MNSGDTFCDKLEELRKTSYTVSEGKDDILYKCVEERINRSLNNYYCSLMDSYTFLIDKNEKELALALQAKERAKRRAK